MIVQHSAPDLDQRAQFVRFASIGLDKVRDRDIACDQVIADQRAMALRW